MQRVFMGLLLAFLGICINSTASAQQGQEQPQAQKGSSYQACIDCHRQINPKTVSDWELSAHAKNDVGCDSCHGDKHMSKDDTEKAEPVLLEKCGECHDGQAEQFKKGKHALAWVSMNAMPTLHWQPMAQIEGLKGCGGCHRQGIKSPAEIQQLRESKSLFGVSSCDVCHTRHVFSVAEARAPQSCRTCHMGIDHPQWEMYSSAKHGVRYELVQNGDLPEDAAAPTCQTCHMQGGNHEVRTAWGFLAVRLPMPDDPKWAADRTTILQALGVLDPEGKPTARLEAVKAADMARLTQESWQAERDKMIRTCNQCHSINFAKAELEKGDLMIRDADRLMAEGIRIVASLYQDGLLKRPQNYAAPYPDLLTFHDAPTVIEQRLFLMFLEHRMRTFQGAFHCNPDYSFWYGWSEMQRDLTDIKERAAEMRARTAAVSASGTSEKQGTEQKKGGKKK